MKITKKTITLLFLSTILTNFFAYAESTAGSDSENCEHCTKDMGLIPEYSEDSSVKSLIAVSNEITIPSKATQQGYSVVYHYEDGTKVVRSKGSRAWRNNNPGNIIDSGFARSYGSIGKGAKFAVFPTKEHGLKALKGLLSSSKWSGLTLKKAIYRYAPPNENNSAKYLQHVVKEIGRSQDTKLADLTSAEMDKLVSAIVKKEGWIVGKTKE